MSVMSQVEYLAQELKDNARMKRRQANLLEAEAKVLDDCSERITRALEVDAKRKPQGDGQ